MYQIQVDFGEKSTTDEIKIDVGRLNKFLGRVEPLVSHYLDDNIQRPNVLRKITQTTREYPSIIIIFSSGHIKLRYSGDDSAQELFALTYPEVLLDKEIQVTGLSWSSNGSSVLVGYGSTSHEGLCMHKGAVCSWNIERHKINPSKPDMAVETSACVTSIACHPERPGIVAAGLYNGSYTNEFGFFVSSRLQVRFSCGIFENKTR